MCACDHACDGAQHIIAVLLVPEHIYSGEPQGTQWYIYPALVLSNRWVCYELGFDAHMCTRRKGRLLKSGTAHAPPPR